MTIFTYFPLVRVGKGRHANRDLAMLWLRLRIMIYSASLQGKGKLIFFNRQLEQVYQVAVSDAVS